MLIAIKSAQEQAASSLRGIAVPHSTVAAMLLQVRQNWAAGLRRFRFYGHADYPCDLLAVALADAVTLQAQCLSAL